MVAAMAAVAAWGEVGWLVSRGAPSAAQHTGLMGDWGWAGGGWRLVGMNSAASRRELGP